MSIRVEDLSKWYGPQKAVDSISFSLGKGEIVGFLGPNGAGKSTTMKILSTYLPASSGKAYLCDYAVDEQPMEVRRRLGYLPESNPLYLDMYVREYLQFTAQIHRLGKSARTRIQEMIELTGLGKEAHKKIGALSKGYRQRVGIAQAMLHDPEVLIMDEPTTGLDPNQIVEIRELIQRIGKEKTVLLSTHIMQEVQAMCSRVIIIHGGKLVADAPLDQLSPGDQQAEILLILFEGPVALSWFDGFEGIESIEMQEGKRFRIHTHRGPALKQEIMRKALKDERVISEIGSQSQGLEEVFRSLTKQPSASSEPAG